MTYLQNDQFKKAFVNLIYYNSLYTMLSILSIAYTKLSIYYYNN